MTMRNNRIGWIGGSLVVLGLVALAAGSGLGSGTWGPGAGPAGWVGPGMMQGWGGGAVAGPLAAPSTAAAANPSANGVHLAGSKFSPAQITVSAGTTVTWLNDDTVPHTVTAADGSWSSGNLAPGAAYTRTFTTRGTFHYLCLYHPWMQGTITVS